MRGRGVEGTVWFFNTMAQPWVLIAVPGLPLPEAIAPVGARTIYSTSIKLVYQHHTLIHEGGTSRPHRCKQGNGTDLPRDTDQGGEEAIQNMDIDQQLCASNW